MNLDVGIVALSALASWALVTETDVAANDAIKCQITLMMVREPHSKLRLW